MFAWESKLIVAMDRTLEVGVDYNLDSVDRHIIQNFVPPQLRFDHLLDMKKRFEENIGTYTAFSENKANRWLSWIQCAIIAIHAIKNTYDSGYDHNDTTSEDLLNIDTFKAINKDLI